MKKIILILLCISLILPLVACGNENAETTLIETETEKATETETEEPTQESAESPTEQPTEKLTETPTEVSTEAPTQAPTKAPTETPTTVPTEAPTEAPVERPTDGPEISGEPDWRKKTYYYKTYEEFRESFLNLPEYDLQSISEFEEEYLYGLCQNSYVSDDEIRNGIFANFRKNIIENDRIMIPYVNDEMCFVNYQGNQSIALHSLYENTSLQTSCKPAIRYATENRVGIVTTYVDKSLIDEATEKGPSWLSSKLDVNAINAANKDKFLSEESQKHVFVNEEECSLGDRNVTAIFAENASNPDNPYYYISFLYDDIFVCVFGKKAAVEEILPTLTFYEVEFSTGKPLRDTPGRTAEYLAEK